MKTESKYLRLSAFICGFTLFTWTVTSFVTQF